MLKKVFLLLLVGFAIYYLLSTPDDAADFVSSSFSGIMDAFQQVGVFFNELVK
ncbi:hypothetical protein [Aeromicrobium sp. Root236]|uniref:hypothetical protein n=1 Tax=Aeromicrobium sp. Root236 TaxID=1736498 RepID=UPI000B000235|nr:hypothetical protein [Aeromicrobium sp. Root236]